MTGVNSVERGLVAVKDAPEATLRKPVCLDIRSAPLVSSDERISVGVLLPDSEGTMNDRVEGRGEAVPSSVYATVALPAV